MPEDIKTRPLTADECATPEAFRDSLRSQEATQRREIVGCGLLVGSSNQALMANVFDAKVNLKSKDLAPLLVDVVPNNENREKTIARLLLGRKFIEYAEVAIGGTPTWLLVSRPGRTLTYTGKISTFGGQDDSGMREDEGLAIIGKDNFAATVARHQSLFPGTPLFTDAQDPLGTPRGRALNPAAFYLACRWNYQSEISRKDLINCTITVRNKISGEQHGAIAADWGPHQRTGRIADLSPGLAKALNLRTDDECIVTVTGPAVIQPVLSPVPGTLTPTDAPSNLRVFGQAELEQKFGNITPVHENGDGSFNIQNPGFNANIVTADISPLSGVRGVPNSGKVECHSAIKSALEAAVQELVAAGKKNLIVTWDGLFVPRHILWDQSRGFSTHSWGIAFDINVNWNGYASRPAPAGSRGSVAELVPLFAKHGFTWGGHWKTPDGMHFQYGLTPK